MNLANRIKCQPSTCIVDRAVARGGEGSIR